MDKNDEKKKKRFLRGCGEEVNAMWWQLVASANRACLWQSILLATLGSIRLLLYLMLLTVKKQNKKLMKTLPFPYHRFFSDNFLYLRTTRKCFELKLLHVTYIAFSGRNPQIERYIGRQIQKQIDR